MEALFAAYALVFIESSTLGGTTKVQTVARFDSRENCEYAARQIGIWAGRGLVCLPGTLPGSYR